MAAVIASTERIGELEAAKAAKKEGESCPCSCQEQPAGEETQQKVCPVCGESSDGKFCPKCGAPRGEEVLYLKPPPQVVTCGGGYFSGRLSLTS